MENEGRIRRVEEGRKNGPRKMKDWVLSSPHPHDLRASH